MDFKEAKEIQTELASKVIITPLKKTPRLIAGVDTAFEGDIAVSAACLFTYPELQLISTSTAKAKAPIPYVPGFLSFREGDAVKKALKGLNKKPDLIIFDGQGIAHPRGLGIASHIGVELNIPTIGCAKSRLVGQFDEPAAEKGNFTDLIYKGKKIGAVVRSRTNVRPLFISPGHLVSIKDSIKIILNCSTKYRLPEPVRMADKMSREAKSKKP